MKIVKVEKNERLRGWLWKVRINSTGEGPIPMYFWNYENAKEYSENNEYTSKVSKEFFNMKDEDSAYAYVTSLIEDIEEERLINV